MSNITELTMDFEDLENLEGIAVRPRWKQLLLLEKEKLQNEIMAAERAKAKSDSKMSNPVKVVKLPTIKITSYAWDQSDKFVKIYLSNLNGVQNADSKDIHLTSDQPHCLTINNLNGKTYVFNVPKLLHSVTTATFKVKTDMILLMLKKETMKTWDCLTEHEKAVQDEKKKIPPMDKNEDPSASIMTMMKKMYDEGDADMKRTIAKAWTESRDKTGTA